MVNFVQIVLLSLIVFACACGSKTNTVEIKRADVIPSPVPLGTLGENGDVFPITGPGAGEIAKKYLGLDPDTKELVACDGGLFWQVVYLTKQLEVTVSKTEGKVYSVKSISRNITNEQNGLANVELPVTPQIAADIATRHFIEYGRKKYNSGDDILHNYFASVCNLGDKWRVLFILNDIKNLKTREDIAKLPNHTPPDYVIDKATGNIVYFSHAGHD